MQGELEMLSPTVGEKRSGGRTLFGGEVWSQARTILKFGEAYGDDGSRAVSIERELVAVGGLLAVRGEGVES